MQESEEKGAEYAIAKGDAKQVLVFPICDVRDRGTFLLNRCTVFFRKFVLMHGEFVLEFCADTEHVWTRVLY